MPEKTHCWVAKPEMRLPEWCLQIFIYNITLKFHGILKEINVQLVAVCNSQRTPPLGSCSLCRTGDGSGTNKLNQLPPTCVLALPFLPSDLLKWWIYFWLSPHKKCQLATRHKENKSPIFIWTTIPLSVILHSCSWTWCHHGC